VGVHRELPQVLRDLPPIGGELRRVLVSFFDGVWRILGHEEVEPAHVCWRI
jgi:hypothetical protein